MCAKKNLSAQDLSEKFGFQISEKDLEPEIDKDSKYLNQMADLSDLIAEERERAVAAKPSAPEAGTKEPEKEPTFAELFESRGSVAAVREDEPPKPAPKREKNKLVNEEDDMDFGRLFNMSSAKVVDKDKLTLPDEDYEPFEISEEKMPENSSFHGFDDLAKAFGGKKKK